jgi:hypothetical protein
MLNPRGPTYSYIIAFVVLVVLAVLASFIRSNSIEKRYINNGMKLRGVLLQNWVSFF